MLDRRLQSIAGDYRKLHLKLAYSGGLDSTVLLHLLVALRATGNFSLQAIHVHHGIHADADAWAESCRSFCQQHGVEFHLEKVALVVGHHGLEAAARDARYRALAAHNQTEADVLLTAHHRDDQAETLLLHLVRGAGVSGLAGMPSRRPLGNGWLCRPLLDISRKAIRHYALAHDLKWLEDDSNTDPDVRRSFLRQQIFPPLLQHWPNAIGAMAQTAGHMAEANALLATMADEDLRPCRNIDEDSVSVSCLAQLSPERQRNALRFWIRAHEIDVPSTRQLAELVRLIAEPPRTAQAELVWGAHCLRIYRDRMWLQTVAAVEPGFAARLLWDLEDPEPVQVGNVRLSAIPGAGEGLARARTGSRVEIRLRQGGERCRLPGRTHRTSVKSLLQQHRVPPWVRRSMPLLFVDNQLAAIGDRWVCEPYAARAGEESWIIQLAETGGKTGES